MSTSFPVTNGYTINLIRTSKNQSKSKYVVKTTTRTGLDKNATFFVSCSEDAETVIEEVAEEVLDQGEFFIADIAQEELIYDTTQVVAEEVVNSENVEVIPEDACSVIGQNKRVFCDICQTYLSCAKDAVQHMHCQHGILTYQGPLFQCDFCGPLVLVTDRVSHMKKTHYLPLEAGFSRTDNQYNCLSCSYTSDQLTNIRNHVDAKHTTGGTTYQCAVCQTVYKTLNSLRAHKSRVHGKKRKRQLMQNTEQSQIKQRRAEGQIELKINSPECHTQIVLT